MQPQSRHRCGRALVCLVATLAMSLRPAGAQEPVASRPGDRASAPKIAVRAVFVPDGLSVDGRLDERVYEDVPVASTFVQQEPHEGELATEKTDAWVFFDNKNLYIAARMWDSHPERILASEMRRDNPAITSDGESLTIVLDTFHDLRTGYLLVTNPLGGLLDASFINDVEANTNFDLIWNSRAGRFDHGWTVEIEIPFKSLRYTAAGEQEWGINLRRIVRWKNEVSVLSLVPASFGIQGIKRMDEAATLVGLLTPAASKNIEIKPYGLSRRTTDRLSSPPRSGDVNGDFGLNFKYGITRGLTADFTYNTDFAQVEDDQQQVNLTRFTLFFPEKRDFFLEGQGIFAFGGASDTTELPVLFFSRRIGLENGQPVPIRVGGRMTGKISRFTLGLLNVDTEQSTAAAVPSTSFRVVRLKSDVFERGAIGIMATERAPSGGQHSYAFGADTSLGFGLTRINGYYARTHTAGRTGRSASYYGQIDYNADRYGVTLEHLTVEPQFTPEVGLLRRTDFRKEYGLVRFSPRPKHLAGVRKLYFEGSLKYIADTAGRLQSRAAVADLRADLNNGDSLGAYYERDYELIPKPFALRPDVIVPVGGYPFDTATFTYTLGPLRPMRGVISANIGSFYSGTRQTVSYSTGRIEAIRHLWVEPTVAENWVDLPWGRFRSDLVSTRTTYSFSPRSELAALVQFNSTNHSISSNVRFRWEYVPGSHLFVVYNDARTTLAPDRFADLQNRTILIKMTRLFRF